MDFFYLLIPVFWRLRAISEAERTADHPDIQIRMHVPVCATCYTEAAPPIDFYRIDYENLKVGLLVHKDFAQAYTESNAHRVHFH